jgi:GTP pyrophosphokinase
MEIEELINKIKKTRPDADLKLVEKAYKYAENKHYTQKRLSGDAYIQHPLAVASILIGLDMDEETIAASLLHDVIEDTDTTKQDIIDSFGIKVADLVDGVTKLGTIDFSSFSKSELQAAKFQAELEHLRKFFVAMAKDIRVVIIKLADRLHNMRTLDSLETDNQKRISRETLEIFAPLADRLGMGRIKAELEDLAFKYSDPAGYKYICSLLETDESERKNYMVKILKFIKQELKNERIESEVDGRAKHIYSIYRKLKSVNDDFSQIHDLLAIRIIVNNIEDCYKVLGIIHKHFKPLIYKIKDYIAVPKPNGYQSLHTTVFGLNGRITEIQIRTHKMHEEAENGVAAHWHYNETKNECAYVGKTSFATSNRTNWVKNISNLQNSVSTAEEFAEMLNIDIFSDRVFVFSPKGDIFDLPIEATPVDFAYEVHSAIGDRCRGAKVNGKIVSLDYKLENRDVVEVILAPKNDINGPSRGWLEFVKTVKARQRIKSWFGGLNKEQNLEEGERLLKEELVLYGLEKANFSEDQENLVVGNAGWKTWEDVLIAVGKGSVTARWLVRKIIGQKAFKDRENSVIEERPDQIQKISSDLKIQNLHGILVRYAECCKPTKNDKVKGFITQGMGITIHKASCHNLLTSPQEKIIDVNIGSADTTIISIEIIGIDKLGLIHDISEVMKDENANILKIQNEHFEKDKTKIKMEIDLDYPEKVTDLLPRILKIDNVISVTQKE